MSLEADRRHFERHVADIPARWRRVQLNSVSEETQSGRIIDVSEGGCCLIPSMGTGRLSLGGVVELVVDLTSGPLVRRALVVADPARDGRLHLAVSTSAEDEGLLTALAVAGGIPTVPEE